MSAEKKHITVLFADVAGSMDLQERLDPEVWAQIMGRFVSILAEGVRKYGGTVDKFTGDGIMALFGAPVAQEDHARRACHAVWHLTKTIGEYSGELRRQQGVELHVRLGLNSGEVVVGRVGEDVTLDPTALGHTVGLAQRMEAMAEPGTAYLTGFTARLVDGWFDLEELGARLVKGASEPVEVYSLGGPLSSPVRRTVGAAPLVGRKRELALLEDALDMASEGHFQVVGVVGEAGVGKSRLCDEFDRSARARNIAVRRASGVSHGRDVPLLPILSFQRDYFGISESNDPASARRKVTDRLLDLDPGLEDTLPLLFDFLEVADPDRPVPPMAPEVRMRRIFDAVRRITARRSERETLVLIFEDLHWFDPQSEAFLGRLIDSYPGSRTLVVANFRPEFSASWMRHSYYRQLGLGPLRDAAVGELLGGLLGMGFALAPLLGFVQERTGGNPFFVEELVRALVEDGTLAGEPGCYQLTRPLLEVKVPPTVQAVLAARIDRLPAEQKAVLQTAAVIGRTFQADVLCDVTGSSGDVLVDALAGLCAAELIQECGTGHYRFWHPLTQEVAYGSLLSDRRASLHAAVARAFIELGPTRLDEQAALAASHFERAGETLEAARWNARAARHVLRNDIAEAMRRWEASIALLRELPPTEDVLRLGVTARTRLLQFGSRKGLSSEDAERLFNEGKALAEQLGDTGQLAGITQFYGTVVLARGEVEQAVMWYVEAAKLADRADDVERQACGGMSPPVFMAYTGPLPHALRWAEKMLELCGDNADLGVQYAGYSPLVSAIRTRGEILGLMGRLPGAYDEIKRALTMARGRLELEMVAWCLASCVRVAHFSGQERDSLAAAEEAVKLTADSGNVMFHVAALCALGIVELAIGGHQEAVATLNQAAEEGRAHDGGHFDGSRILSQLAHAHLAMGDLEAAVELSDEAVAVAQRQGVRILQCEAHVTRAHILRISGLDSALQTPDDHLRAALALSEQSGALTFKPFIREELGRLHEDETELREALRLYRQIGATGHARRLEPELSPRPVR